MNTAKNRYGAYKGIEGVRHGALAGRYGVRIYREEPQGFAESDQLREGVLCWYPFREGADVLDLSGGALSGLLERRCGRVTAGAGVPSGQDAAAGSVGTQGGQDAAAVSVGTQGGQNAADAGFDYIVLIDPEDFSATALTQIRQALKPGGRLLLTYENPFALRFWAGKRIDEGALPYDSLFGQAGGPSKAELASRLEVAGFAWQKWYYLLTDHRFTAEVYSDALMPNAFLNQRAQPYIADDIFLQFDERPLYSEVIRNGAFPFMCGAYLVEAGGGPALSADGGTGIAADGETQILAGSETLISASGGPCLVDYAAVTAYREASKRFATTVRGDGTARKTALCPEGAARLEAMLRNHEDLARLGVNVLPLRLEGDSLIMERVSMPTLWDYWAGKLSRGMLEDAELFRHFDMIRDAVYMAAADGKCYWELVPANCFYDEAGDSLLFFDQEYCWDGTAPEMALVRAINALKYSPVFTSAPQSAGWIEELKTRYGLAGCWDEMSWLADVETWREVSGGGLDASADASRRAMDHLTANRRYMLFSSAAAQLKSRGYSAPIVYGYGKRGKTLCAALEDQGAHIAAIVDRGGCAEYRSLNELPVSIAADIVIVSILNGGAVAEGLRRETELPVIMADELMAAGAADPLIGGRRCRN